MADSTNVQSIDWSTDNASGLVQISTHKMFLRAAGPPRKPGAPVVVVECGLGSTSCQWTAVARQISEFARIYTYDRSGLDKSDRSPLPRTAENMAKELKELLEAAKVEPPYVVIAHSYGGVLAREFLALEEGNVAGMVFEEANSEFSYKNRPQDLEELIGIFWSGMDQNAITNMDKRHRLTPEEWTYAKRDEPEEEQKVVGEEMQHYYASCETLGQKKQFEKKVLGNRPVCVIKGDNAADMQPVFDEAVKQGRGTEAQRKTMRDWIANDDEELRLQEQQLELSSKGRLVRARKSGHNVQLTEPELISEAVRWILEVHTGEKE